MAVIGPSQSGKTATVVAGILDWEGPAILSSVKNDLFDETVARRLQFGEVFVFDPMRTIPELPEGATRIGWSPLHAARTVPGAIEVSLALLDAAPTDGVTNANYWSSKGQALLWPILFAAAHDPNSTMAHVVRWLTSQDGNTEGGSGQKAGAAAPRAKQFSEVRSILCHVSESKDRRDCDPGRACAGAVRWLLSTRPADSQRHLFDFADLGAAVGGPEYLVRIFEGGGAGG